ncbi:MAG: carbohydrate ABC transporter permease [Bacillota bacterium]
MGLASRNRAAKSGRGYYKNFFRDVLLHLILIAGVVLILLPAFWLVICSLQTEYQLRASLAWWPRPFAWENYLKVFRVMPFFLLVRNSLFVAGVNILGCISASALTAYAFAKLRAPGKDVLFVLLLASMMLPNEVTMIPVFIIWRRLGLTNTFFPLTVPSFLGGGAFNVFLLRQFFLGIPNELSEAAEIDGCSLLGIFFRIILPLAKPALGVIAIFTFIGNWNDFQNPLIYLNDQNLYTLALGLQAFAGQTGGAPLSILLAGSVLTLLPVVILFFAAQKTFMRGINLSFGKE